MNSLLVSLVAFIATMLLIVLLKPVAIAIGLTDKPNERKQHVGSIPLIGGIAIFLGFALAVLVSPWVTADADPLSGKLKVYLAASFILVIAGAWDDYRGLTPLSRLIVQILVALIMVSGAGLVIVDLGSHVSADEHAILERLAVPFTVFATVGLINAINMSDGLDGLSGNMTLVSFLGFGVAHSVWGGSSGLEFVNVMSAAIVGFLVFNQRMNWRPAAAVFLGDAGSMMLGFSLAWVAIEISQGPTPAVSPVAVLWFLLVPVYDTMAVIVRRLLNGRSPFHADARHLHHVFVGAGFSVTATIAILCGLALAGVAVGLVATWRDLPDWQVMGVYLVGWLIYLTVVQRAWNRRRFLGRPVN